MLRRHRMFSRTQKSVTISCDLEKSSPSTSRYYHFSDEKRLSCPHVVHQDTSAGHVENVDITCTVCSAGSLNVTYTTTQACSTSLPRPGIHASEGPHQTVGSWYNTRRSACFSHGHVLL